MTTITIKWKPLGNVHEFKGVFDVIHHMWGRDPKHYLLFINGRRYDWPGKEHFGGFTSNIATSEQIKKHLEYCIELDKAFYG